MEFDNAEPSDVVVDGTVQYFRARCSMVNCHRSNRMDYRWRHTVILLGQKLYEPTLTGAKPPLFPGNRSSQLKIRRGYHVWLAIAQENLSEVDECRKSNTVIKLSFRFYLRMTGGGVKS